jgi:hypothetical protein
MYDGSMTQPASITKVPTLRYEDIAELLGVTVRTVRKYANNGDAGRRPTFPCTRVGPRSVRFTDEQAEAIVEIWTNMQGRNA